MLEKIDHLFDSKHVEFKSNSRVRLMPEKWVIGNKLKHRELYFGRVCKSSHPEAVFTEYKDAQGQNIYLRPIVKGQKLDSRTYMGTGDESLKAYRWKGDLKTGLCEVGVHHVTRKLLIAWFNALNEKYVHLLAVDPIFRSLYLLWGTHDSKQIQGFIACFTDKHRNLFTTLPSWYFDEWLVKFETLKNPLEALRNSLLRNNCKRGNFSSLECCTAHIASRLMEVPICLDDKPKRKQGLLKAQSISFYGASKRSRLLEYDVAFPHAKISFESATIKEGGYSTKGIEMHFDRFIAHRAYAIGGNRRLNGMSVLKYGNKSKLSRLMKREGVFTLDDNAMVDAFDRIKPCPVELVKIIKPMSYNHCFGYQDSGNVFVVFKMPEDATVSPVSPLLQEWVTQLCEYGLLNKNSSKQGLSEISTEEKIDSGENERVVATEAPQNNVLGNPQTSSVCSIMEAYRGILLHADAMHLEYLGMKSVAERLPEALGSIVLSLHSAMEALNSSSDLEAA